ncbi:MAG: bacteriohemerythrin [Nitrospirae bacterium]|nr:bacteriohemerythrin [Nitrospirota bacterium]
MALFTWSDKYSVNINEIDNQHKKLIGIINELHDAMSKGKSNDILSNVLQDLIDYTRVHFANEERIMNMHGYHDYTAHKAAHEDLLRQVTKFDKEFREGKFGLSIQMMNFLKDWLSKHILETDKKYSPFLNSKGVI